MAGTCVAGCKNDQACASGKCLASHDCLNCQNDLECAQGRLCGTGVCTAPCSSTCTDAGWSCCGGRCVDQARDPLHCGGCTAPCPSDTFCGRSQCRAATLSNLCQLPVACTMLNGVFDDETAGLAVSSALVSSCSPSVTSHSAGQSDAGVLNPVTGEPLVLGELLVAGGGSFRQRAVAWLEANNLAPVRDTSSTTLYRYSLRDGGTITSGPVGNITPSHDIFVVQLARSTGGAAVLNAAGYYAEGTAAAAWFVVNRVAPNLSTYTDTWYVIDWVDTNPNLTPDNADTWTVVASGQ